MRSSLVISTRRLIAGLMVGLFLGHLVGCSWIDQYRGEGYKGDDATWGQAFRSQEAPARLGERFFFNEKSEQIEQSLGY